MSIQRVQCVLLFLVRFNNSVQFEIYRVTHSSSSRPFLCDLVGNIQLFVSVHGTNKYLPVFKVYKKRTFGRIVDRVVCDEYVSHPQGGAAIVPARAGEHQGEGGR